MSAVLSMPAGGQPLDQLDRIAALEETELLDSAAEREFDVLTAAAVRALDADISLVSLVDRDRQFFKSGHGLDEPLRTTRQTPLSHSFCQYVVTRGSALRVVDARNDPLVSKNLAVTDFGVVGYLGVPLRTADGYLIGSFCAITKAPREWDARDSEILESLAAAAEALIHCRREVDALQRRVDDAHAIESRRSEHFVTLVHDIRTPVSAIVTSIDILQQPGNIDPEQTAFLEIARDSAESLLTIANDLLDVHRIDAAGLPQRREPVLVSKLLRAALSAIRAAATRKNITLTFTQHRAELECSGDSSLLRRVLINLVENAVKFSPDGGTVIVTVSSDSESVRFSISDNGPGIPDEEKDRIFEKFQTLSRGTSFGIGLAFCKAVIASHGGTIRVSDAPGGGSTFEFTVPSSRSLAVEV